MPSRYLAQPINDAWCIACSTCVQRTACNFDACLLQVVVFPCGRWIKSEDPQEVEDWLADLNKESEEQVLGALGCPQLREAKVGGGWCWWQGGAPDALTAAGEQL